MSLAFPSTKWTLVRRLADPETCKDAFQVLCEKYWGRYSRFCVAGTNGLTRKTSLKSFFYVVMKQELFQRANPMEGKLRSWLLKSLEYCLANRARSHNALKRGGQVKIAGLQEEAIRNQYEASRTMPNLPSTLSTRLG